MLDIPVLNNLGRVPREMVCNNVPRYAELSPGPAAFLIPTAVKTVEGRLIQPHQSLKEALADGGECIIIIRIMTIGSICYGIPRSI